MIISLVGLLLLALADTAGNRTLLRSIWRNQTRQQPRNDLKEVRDAMTKIEKRKEKVAKSSFAVQGRAGKLTQKRKGNEEKKGKGRDGKEEGGGETFPLKSFSNGKFGEAELNDAFHRYVPDVAKQSGWRVSKLDFLLFTFFLF